MCSFFFFSPPCSSEVDRYLLEFRGGTFPLSAIGSFKGSGSGGGRKGRDSSKLRRSNTSPRKKGSPASSWSCGGSFRDGKMSAPIQGFYTKANVAVKHFSLSPESLKLLYLKDSVKALLICLHIFNVEMQTLGDLYSASSGSIIHKGVKFKRLSKQHLQ